MKESGMVEKKKKTVEETVKSSKGTTSENL